MREQSSRFYGLAVTSQFRLVSGLTAQKWKLRCRTPKMGKHSNGCGNHFECFLSKCCKCGAYKFLVVPVFSKKLPSSVTLNVGAPTFLFRPQALSRPGHCFTHKPNDSMLNLWSIPGLC